MDLLNAVEIFNAMTEGPWWTDLSALAVALTAAGVVWRMAVWPFFRGIWAAVRAAPQIPVILAEIEELLRSNVIDKLEAIDTHMSGHAVEALARDNLLSQHTAQLDDHEMRIVQIERRDET